MRIAITGATGYVGSYLTEQLKEDGHEVIPLGRNFFKEGGKNELQKVVNSAQVVINLAGAPINKRWNKKYKKELYDSRVLVTRALAECINASPTPPEIFISTSAIGYYETNGVHDENGRKGKGFLSDLCLDWEKEALKTKDVTRLVITRFGVVLSKEDGALAELIRMQNKFHFGTIIGNGKQSFPWISLNDLCSAMKDIINNNNYRGIVNMVSPQNISQAHLARVLAKAYKVRLLLFVPKWILRIVLGEGASFVTEGSHVIPSVLERNGFKFKYPTIESLLT